MIGQAHLDPVWLWRWTEGRAEAIATSQSAVDRLDEYPDFQFVRGESQVYAWVAQEDPALFARIREYIRQGRWHVVNGMVIQPDMNLPNGESLVRQVLLGKRMMRELLGVEPRVAYCVDSFGHAGTLPQILARCGFDSFVFMRPGPHEKTLPSEVFWWQGPDGSRVLTFRIASAYQTRMGDHSIHIDDAVRAMPSQLDQTMCFFGVGNHGGGPTKEQIEDVQELAASSEQLDIRFSSPADYFAAIQPRADQLPVVAEELQFHAVGCYAAVSNLKRAHRQAENGLLLAERLAVLAELWTGKQVPADQLRELWNVLCFNQFHDILGGSATREASEDAVTAFGHVIHSAAQLVDDAGRAIAAQIDTSGAGGAIVLFNPFPETLTQYIEYEPWTSWQPWDAGKWGLIDETSQPVPYQQIEPHEALSATRGSITRLVFPVSLPPLGYRTYRFGPALPQADVTGSARATATTLENDLLFITLDLASGAISSCVDKRSGLELVGPGGWNMAQVLEDTSDTWSHGIRTFDQQIGTFGEARVIVRDTGPLEASLLLERRYEGNTWVQQIVLRHGESEVLIRNWLVWQGHWRMLKLAFDVATDNPEASHDIPFGWCARACDGMEVPTHMWMDVSGPAREQPDQCIGAALLNDGKYSCDVRGSVMRLTVLRSPPYAYHIPHVIGTRSRYDWIDQGAQEWTLVLRPHVGDWRDAGVVSRARTLNMPPIAITAHSHTGALPPVASQLALDAPDLELTALKQADDGNGYIVRVADRHGRGGQGTLQWNEQAFPIVAAPFEVVTLRLERIAELWTATACDMIEG